jgi:hypothetical protein
VVGSAERPTSRREVRAMFVETIMRSHPVARAFARG